MLPKTVLCSIALLLALLVACTGLAEGAMDRTGRYPLNAYGEAVIDDVTFAAPVDVGNNRVFYEIFVGSFSDSDGDGVGDLRGIINRMDYLNDGDPQSGVSLGVEGIWLTPVFASPSYHKYDITDYYTIDEAFGTMDDLRELVALCHERGVKVILDLPINHTGRLNSWFQRFSTARLMHNEKNVYYDFYTCIPNGSQIPAGRHFTPLRGTDFAYEANFSDDMPELNYDNPLVRETMLDVARYYLELGIDGFRFDAAKYIYFGDHDKCVDFWQWYIDALKAINPDVYTVAEVWDSDGTTDRYYPAVNCFNFTTSQIDGMIASTAKQGDVNKLTAYVERYINNIHTLNEQAMLVPFIANHDTDRAAGYLTVASGNMQMAANLYLLMPGSPFIYYGEEIGLRGSRGGANTDANRRLAMLWGDGDTVHDPIGATYEAKKQTPYAVADLLGNGGSIYSYYKRLLMIRKANPEIACGAYHAPAFAGTKLGGFTAVLNGSTVAVLHNTTLHDITIDLADVTELADMHLTDWIGMGEDDAAQEGTLLLIPTQTSVILR